MTTSKDRINYITTAAFIAVAYAALTYFGGFFGLSYGPVQLRFSEVLTVLPVFTPAAIPGLTIGCFLANIGSFNPLDMVFGTFATLIAALLTYLWRNIRFKKLPLLSLLPPVIVNAVIIGAEISIFFLPQKASLYGYLISAFYVGIGEFIVCYCLGIPVFLALVNTKISKLNFLGKRK